MGGKVRRRLVILGLVAVGVALAAMLVIHTPWARNRALSWAIGFVTRYHLVLEAGNLGYNAITRRITLTDVRLAAEGHKDRPFLVASRIEVALPWLVYRGRFAIDHLTIENGIVDIIRDEHDVVNLPPGSDRPPPEQARRLDIRNLTLRGLDVQYVDKARDWGVKVPRIESTLRHGTLGSKGDFGVRGPIAFRLRDRTMTFAPFQTVMTFDGSDVQLESATLSSSEIEAFLSGPIKRVLDAPSLDLTLKGTIDLHKAMRWVPPPPVPVSGLATLDGSIKGPAGSFVVDLGVTSRALDVGREKGLSLKGPVRVTFQAFTGHDLVIAPASGGSIRAAFTVPWGGQGTSTASAEWDGLDSQAALRLANVDPQNIGAAFAGRGTFEFGAPMKFVVSNRSTARPGRGVVAVSGTIDATIVGDDYRYDHDHQFPGFGVSGRMSGRINRGAATLTTMLGPAHARVSDVAEAVRSIETLGAPVAAIMQEIHGGIDAPMTLAGSYRHPEITTTVKGDAVDLPLLGRVSAAATVAANTKTATISAIDIRRGSSAITGNVIADITRRAWDGKLHVEAPKAEELQAEIPEAWRVSGSVSADAALGGTFDSFQLDTTITGGALTFAGQPIDRVTAKAMVTADAIDVTSLELHQGVGYLSGRAGYAWESGAYTASLKGDRLVWQGSLFSPNDTQAIFAVQFDGAGTAAQPKGQARLDFALTGGPAGTFIGAGEATADLLGDQARVTARLPSIGALVDAEVATASPYDYRVKAQLDRFELARLSPFIGAIEAEVLGFANGTITASGRLADDRDRVAFVSITELDAGIGGVPVTLNAPFNVELRGDQLTLKDLFARVGSGRVSASGEWNTRLAGTFRAEFAGDFQDAIRLGKAFGVPVTFDGSGPLALQLQSDGTRPGTNATVSLKNGTFNFVNQPAAIQALTVDAALKGEALTVSRISGDVATGGIVGSFSASGAAKVPVLELSAIDGQLTLDAAKFTFSGIPVAQQRPSRFEFANGNVAMADVSWLIAENPLVFGGSVGFAADDPPLDLSLKGVVDLRVLSAFTSAVAFDGNADVNTLINGTVARPLLDGRITLDNAEIAVSEPRLLLADLTGAIVLDGQLAVFDGVRGLANGGDLGVDGTLEFDGTALAGGELNIQAQTVALEMPRGLRSELNALVTFRPDPKSPSITGVIRIAQSSYTETITLAALARQAALPLAPAATVQPYLERLRLNLDVTTTEDLIVDNNYGRLAAGANVRLIGTVAEPGLDGRITLREGGQVYLAGRTFRLTRGDISFTDRRRIHPEFNIVAEANLGSGGAGMVTMTLTGDLQRPTIDLTSEDSGMTPGEIAAELVGSSSGNTQAALTLLSADLLGVTGRALGVNMRLERGEYTDPDFREDPSLIGTDNEDPTTRLTVAKRLSDQVEFTISQNLRENGKTTYVISYFPRHNVELRALSRDSGTLSLGVRHQVTFGGGYNRPPSERRVRPAISAITFTGADPADEALAREAMSLEPGDDFDFLELQRDVDRIREAFHRLGFLETRVRTRRTEADDARTVAVEYRIERGPRTRLEFTGFVPPADLTTELEEAWHQNVFDQFLVDDLTHRVRRHLVTSNDLGSIVVGRIDRPAAGEKRLRIDVTPGAPVTGREIRFTGNQQIKPDRLQVEIAEAGLAVEAWLDRTLVERRLRQLYNEEGYLKAEVIGRPLTIDGTTGVLWMDIAEGPRAQITSVTWTGVAEARRAETEKTAEVKTPSPYVVADVNAARLRIEEHYRDQGFNDVEVEATPVVSADDTVVLGFTVVEGPQQVLQAVEMTGLEVTQGKVLTEALDFELGKPVDLDAWAIARKRIYDTNVFRLVDIQPVPAGDAANGVQPIKAIVNVEEYPEWSLRYGVHLEGEREAELGEFTSAQNLGVVGELRNPNLLGRALTLGLYGMYQRREQDATVFLATSRLFGWKRARSTLYGFYEREHLLDDAGEDLVAITTQKGVSADQRWRLGKIQIVYGYRFERSRTFDPDPVSGDPFPLDFVSNLAKLSSAVLFDRRDDPFNARRGTFSSISFDNSALWLGSDVVNRKVLGQQTLFVPLGPVVLASRAVVGVALGRDDLTVNDRFQAGGATTVRGYGEDSLGPRNELTGLATGGDRLMILNQEVRFPIYRFGQSVAANGVTFVDAGNIFDKTEGWGALKVGYGIGLRFDTPFGLLRGDIALPVGDQPTSRSRTSNLRYYFGFGHIF